MIQYDERIKLLREQMNVRNIDFYLIPTADDHASEYISDFYKVRNYYAGFTGSAGTLLIGKDMAGLWTDGRYFIQAENQLKGSLVKLFRMGSQGVPTIAEYLEEHLPEGGSIGFDGQVVDLSQGRIYEEIAEKKGGSIFWNEDIAGNLWQERPKRMSAPVYILEEKYAGKSRRQKLEELRSYMKKESGSRALVASLEDIAWLLNLRGDDVKHTPVFLAFILVEPDKVRLYADVSAFSENIRKALGEDGVELKDYMDVFRSADTFIELVPKGIDKGSSLSYLAKHLNIHRVYALLDW